MQPETLDSDASENKRDTLLKHSDPVSPVTPQAAQPLVMPDESDEESNVPSHTEEPQRDNVAVDRPELAAEPASQPEMPYSSAEPETSTEPEAAESSDSTEQPGPGFTPTESSESSSPEPDANTEPFGSSEPVKPATAPEIAVQTDQESVKAPESVETPAEPEAPTEASEPVAPTLAEPVATSEPVVATQTATAVAQSENEPTVTVAAVSPTASADEKKPKDKKPFSWKKLIVVLVILIIIAGGIFLALHHKNSTPTALRKAAAATNQSSIAGEKDIAFGKVVSDGSFQTKLVGTTLNPTVVGDAADPGTVYLEADFSVTSIAKQENYAFNMRYLPSTLPVGSAIGSIALSPVDSVSGSVNPITFTSIATKNVKIAGKTSAATIGALPIDGSVKTVQVYVLFEIAKDDAGHIVWQGVDNANYHFLTK